ncbi:hypothetical protein EVAR_11345_1 [Eumeta japonica]|uniref:Uncharacterized protein n=1 Tax=Eumeta variegata TaxID=151549 RepID=A0A4C1U0T3_EUMVA|nr:hypothetical protein EVAR_11345_1 [Eumeta japonica]
MSDDDGVTKNTVSIPDGTELETSPEKHFFKETIDIKVAISEKNSSDHKRVNVESAILALINVRCALINAPTPSSKAHTRYQRVVTDKFTARPHVRVRLMTGRAVIKA